MKTASLSSSLLVRKGAAAPSSYAAPVNGTAAETAPPVATPPRVPAVTSRVLAAPAGPKPRVPRQKLVDHNGRVRLSVRFDHDQHTRLQLASVHTKRSMRDLIATAVDTYLRQLSPNVANGDCACLARSGGNG